MFYRLLIVLNLALSFSCEGRVKVAFLQLYHWDGSIRKLEPEFPYGHVALAVGSKWLHAHPVRGVETVSTQGLENIGKIAQVLTADREAAPSQEAIDYFLGRPYDYEFSWDDSKIYCSELIAKLLRIPPSPMHFDPGLWPKEYLKFEGKTGISPSKVYAALIGRGFERSRQESFSP